MTDKVHKIKDWISNEQEGLMDANGNFEYPEHEGAYHILCSLDTYIDSMQEEPVSNDLEELINKLSKQFPEVSFAKLSRIAVRVAKWQKQQFEKNRLKHCDSITNEQAELEQKFLDQHLDKYQRMPTFLDAIEYGMNLQKEQLLVKAFDFTKEHNTACVLASECLRNHGWFNRERDFNDLFRHLSCVDKLFEGKFSGKTKVIVIKEE